MGHCNENWQCYNIPFNGSQAEASALCMDKYLTGITIQELADQLLQTIPKTCAKLNDFVAKSADEFESFWKSLTADLECGRLIVKPRADGCSAGIVLLESAKDFKRYCDFYHQKVTFIPPRSFSKQAGPIEMPTSGTDEVLLEPFIETDEILIEHHDLKHIPKEGWIELTVGILEQEGHYRALNPSITIAEGAVLSLEEKFQGGTGINLTPPPEEILSKEATKTIKALVEKAACALGIQNYARLDVFFNRVTGKMILIEANTLPALTASTVIYHQGLAEEPALPPLALLEKMIASKLTRHELK